MSDNNFFNNVKIQIITYYIRFVIKSLLSKKKYHRFKIVCTYFSESQKKKYIIALEPVQIKSIAKSTAIRAIHVVQ